jgi:hypothetical protein
MWIVELLNKKLFGSILFWGRLDFTHKNCHLDSLTIVGVVEAIDIT